MQLSNEEIQFYQKQALYYCDIALEDIDKMARQYRIDCYTEKIDIVGFVVIPGLTNIYYSVKKGIMSREEAIEQQKSLFEVIELED